MLIDALFKKGIIDRKESEKLKLEIENSRKKEEDIILNKKIISEKQLFQLKSELVNIPFKRVDTAEVSIEILKIFPLEVIKFYKMIPIGIKGSILEIGMVYPEQLAAQDALRFFTSQKKFFPRIFLITLSNFKKILKKIEDSKLEISAFLKELERENIEKLKQREERGEKKILTTGIEKMVSEAPIVKTVYVILRNAVEGQASDIHIEPLRERIRVRFRLNGILYSSIFLPSKILPAIIGRIKILSNLRIDETRVPQDGRFEAKIGEKYINFRVSTFPTVLGEKVVIRVLDPSKGIRTFEQIGLEGENYKIAREAMKRPYGLILITGPTGSGKTTSLYSILNIYNQDNVNIVTLEDPVEYTLDGISHSQARPNIGYTFANGLKEILRQDPDVIMVGEIRDEETASLVIHSALTGHIVLSTLHTNTASATIPRLIDLGIKPYLLPSTLNLIIAQRLVTILCPLCKKRVKARGEIKKMIVEQISILPKSIKEKPNIKGTIYIYKAIGCRECQNKGVKGRIGVFEVLKMTPELEKIILERPTENRIKAESKRQGMITMIQDSILKALRGIISIEEVLRVTEER